MDDMPSCRDCRWWSPAKNPVLGHPMTYGTCLVQYQASTLVRFHLVGGDPTLVDVEMITEPDFGCIQFERKP
jgi:hypothetical protein